MCTKQLQAKNKNWVKIKGKNKTKLGNKINLEDNTPSVHQQMDKQNVDYVNGILSL